MDLPKHKSKHKGLLWFGSLVWTHDLQKLTGNLWKITEEKVLEFIPCIFLKYLNVGENHILLSIRGAKFKSSTDVKLQTQEKSKNLTHQGFFGMAYAQIFQEDLVLDVFGLLWCSLDAFLKFFLTLCFFTSCSSATFCLSASFSFTIAIVQW